LQNVICIILTNYQVRHLLFLYAPLSVAHISAFAPSLPFIWAMSPLFNI